MPSPSSQPSEQNQGACPICERTVPDTAEAQKYHPFCSRRCQQVDLMRWIDGRYAIVDELPDEDEFAFDE
ncbi:DNA gyrase inhibitor YacG [bacterium]|nr:DNA gyrase inhibitor YacG [bacterium]